MALGNAGDILISSTTRELSADSGFSYVDRGIHHLKGIPVPRRIFLLTVADNNDAGAVRA
jgi:class 3 adenylate cyclase